MGYIVLSEHDESFLQEVWGLYIAGMIVFVLRFAVRSKTVGLRGLQWDDMFAALAVIFLTLDAATVHIVYFAGTNVEGVHLSKLRTLSQVELDQLDEGSRIELVAWYSYSTLVWCVKGTMVCFFMRMTAGVARRRMVKMLGWACIISYIAVELTITFGCWPISGNFQVVPDPGIKCTLKPQNIIVMTILNVITDAAILCVPLPLLWTLQIPARQKIVIAILLSSGVFVITAALIRAVITLGSTPSALTVNRWGVRETIVGIVAVNAPAIRPLFSKAFWTGMPFVSSKATKTNTKGGRSTTHGGTGTQGEGPTGPYELAPSVRSGSRGTRHGNDFTGSEESIIDKTSLPNTNTHTEAAVVDRDGCKSPQDGNVVVHTVYEVTEGPRLVSSPRWDHDGFYKASAYGGQHSPV